MDHAGLIGYDLLQILVIDLLFAVGDIEEARIDLVQLLFGEAITKFTEAMLQGMPAGTRGEQDLALLNAHVARIDDLIGSALLEDAVLMDTAGVGKGIGSDNGFIGLNQNA